MLVAAARPARRPRGRRRARARPARVGAGGARDRLRPRAWSRPDPPATCGRSPQLAARAGRGHRGAARRHRHPPRGARRPAQGPARRHRRAPRRRLALARQFAFRVRSKPRPRDQRRLAVPRRPQADRHVPRASSRSPPPTARAGRSPPTGWPRWPPPRRRTGATELDAQGGHVARRAVARRAAADGRGAPTDEDEPAEDDEDAPAEAEMSRPSTPCSPRGRGAAARARGRRAEDVPALLLVGPGALGRARRRQPPAPAFWARPLSAATALEAAERDPRPRRGRGAARLRGQGQRRLLHDVLRLARTRATSPAGARTAASRPTRSRRSRC